ncbi:ATP-dependent nuclease [Streptomyces sp. WI04-05B]|uniref:ATP-dependent nuclease n=1 Tax=Streptomyces TaxID=1883 RepID=UPI0029A120B7|nr:MULTISPECIES: AAA family ATPase [unclassified Streptomyces]MDX2545420.1 AAA family ATPase [Streptomyces sp. WI04-05B]MDX2581807.1 AAA family ATPase [Streptomyces sp. WI04-05A]
MLDVEFVIKNYRCFGDAPTSFRVRDGFTALVGTNNSGKSSLLRLLYEVRPLLNLLHSNSGTSQRQSLQGFRDYTWGPTLLAGERLVRADTDRPMELQIIVHDGPAGPFKNSGEQLIVTTRVNQGHQGFELKVRTESGLELRDNEASHWMNDDFFKPLDAAMQVLSATMYVGPFRNAIHVGAQQNYFDIQTGNAFVGAFAQYKSGNDPSANEAIDEMLQQLSRIFGYQRLDINASGDTFQLFIDGKSYRLNEQGAGFAHFLLVMVNVLVRKPKMLLIDEPELNLHASLQLDFLQTLASYSEYGVIFATHSLGLARTAADFVYTLAKPSGGTSVLRNMEEDQDLVTLLGQMSFDRRPESGFSKVLLVEGKTELRVLMQFLRLYGKEHEVLMLPLHGNDLIRGDSQQELAHLLRIGGAVHYLIDSEREDASDLVSPERQAFVDLCSQLGITGHVLDRRALENYFPDAAVKRAFGNTAQALGAFDKLASGRGAAWRKTNNWRVAAEMRKDDLDLTDLGQFLESL